MFNFCLFGSINLILKFLTIQSLHEKFFIIFLCF